MGSKTIHEKMAELDDMVAWFNGDEFVLETALTKFTAAEALASEIEKDIQSLRNEITVVKEKFDVE